MAIVHRLDRGAFSGDVIRIEDGPWHGWYTSRWAAGQDLGHCGPCSKTYAHYTLYEAMRKYFAKQQTPLK